jgi:hypothetical protein
MSRSCRPGRRVPLLFVLGAWLGACSKGSGHLGSPEEAMSSEGLGDPASQAVLGEVPGTEAVGEITDFDVNDQGDVAFLDALNHRVAVVRATGEVSQMAWRGQGPGAFALPIGTALLSDGSVAVLDLVPGRIILWGPDAGLKGSARVPRLHGHPDPFGAGAEVEDADPRPLATHGYDES